jgi:hypothetical protein
MAAVARLQATKVLYSQDNDASGYALVSTNFGKGDSDDSQAADDCTVPKGQTWTIAQVNVAGTEGSSAPASENVAFAKNTVNAKKQDVPGALVKKLTLKGKNTRGSLVITGIRLMAGHNELMLPMEAVIEAGLRARDSRTQQHGSPAVWQNPGNGFGTGCTRWTPHQTCTGASGRPDLMFALHGSKS